MRVNHLKHTHVMRTAKVNRNTLETQISVSINLDGTGVSSFNTGLGFLDHMLDQIARHGMMDIEVNAKGDLHIDASKPQGSQAPQPQAGPAAAGENPMM